MQIVLVCGIFLNDNLDSQLFVGRFEEIVEACSSNRRSEEFGERTIRSSEEILKQLREDGCLFVTYLFWSYSVIYNTTSGPVCVILKSN